MNHEDAKTRGIEDPEEEPPPFGRWNQWYATVLGFLALLIALFTWFSRS